MPTPSVNKIRMRTLTMAGVILVCLTALILRTAYWQIIRGDELSAKAKNQQQGNSTHEGGLRPVRLRPADVPLLLPASIVFPSFSGQIRMRKTARHAAQTSIFNFRPADAVCQPENRRTGG